MQLILSFRLKTCQKYRIENKLYVLLCERNVTYYIACEIVSNKVVQSAIRLIIVSCMGRFRTNGQFIFFFLHVFHISGKYFFIETRA